MWINCDDLLPPNGHVVIIKFDGFWYGRGHGGVSDCYMWDGVWFNVPDGVRVTCWMFDPDNPAPSNFDLTQRLGNEEDNL